MSYQKLTNSPGIQWPCNDEYPDGCERLYTDGKFCTSFDDCETYGFEITTGAEMEPEKYKAANPKGKAIIKPADYEPPHEEPDKKYPFWLTTGRLVYHFHTRTKTGRSPALNSAAPDVFVQLSEYDASSLGIKEGEMLEVRSRRGKIQAAARVGGIEQGLVFVPFHYGDWDNDERARAANELTITEWDPVSKQPHFKYAAVKVSKVKR